ncbi:hypothetical protein CJD36_019980 [Flavipsychrobacter stenotrophus]|uniref:Uncharacterized protein n=1 Tax=Flavipsychrobacter stenotrophus TaxID=2077091 RepID=A0A2S7SRI2_9BACT|nr:hypothetical protein [Flavipsychrobacter stenotrophus]PQJ09520.1 hypothetical protein CJD36_019980 [Flavipsychrobacter stenotrophus]
MKTFSELNIKSEREHFTGDKVKIGKVLNKQIVVHDYKIQNSKYTDKCLHLQIEVNNSKHVVFTGSKHLIDVIQKVSKDNFPISTTIVENDDGSFQFT